MINTTVPAANNFDLVRTCLALIVVLAHAASLTNEPEFHWFSSVFDSYFAVKGFFVISGYLVMQSYLSSRSLGVFFEKRARRICPAYLLAVGLCLVIGAGVTELPLAEFAASPETWRYLVANLSFLNFFQHTLPGVFVGHETEAMNGSLWTIKIEICLYLCIPLIHALYTRFGALLGTAVLVIASAAWSWYFLDIYSGPLGKELARQFPGFMSYFVIGACLGVGRLRGLLSAPALAACAALYYLSTDTAAALLTQPLFYAVLVLFLATAIRIPVNGGRFGDLSYGTYLYHFPIIQLVVWAGLYDQDAWLGLATSLAATLLMAYLSWHLIEKKLLRRSRRHAASASPASVSGTPAATRPGLDGRTR